MPWNAPPVLAAGDPPETTVQRLACAIDRDLAIIAARLGQPTPPKRRYTIDQIAEGYGVMN